MLLMTIYEGKQNLSKGYWNLAGVRALRALTGLGGPEQPRLSPPPTPAQGTSSAQAESLRPG